MFKQYKIHFWSMPGSLYVVVYEIFYGFHLMNSSFLWFRFSIFLELNIISLISCLLDKAFFNQINTWKNETFQSLSLSNVILSKILLNLFYGPCVSKNKESSKELAIPNCSTGQIRYGLYSEPYLCWIEEASYTDQFLTIQAAGC